MAFDIERENQRHAAMWAGFVKFIFLSAAACAAALALMALFLL